jgi:cell division protein FtsB
VIGYWFKKSVIGRTFMSSIVAEKSALKASQKNVIRQISSLREQVEDLNDYLDLLEARARNQGKRTFTTEEVRKQLGLA